MRTALGLAHVRQTSVERKASSFSASSTSLHFCGRHLPLALLQPPYIVTVEQKAFPGKLWAAYDMEQYVRKMWERFTL